MVVIVLEYKHDGGKVNATSYNVDETFFRFMMSLPATDTGGSAFNTLAYMISEEMYGGAQVYAWADKPGIIRGIGVSRDAVVQAMLKEAGTRGQMDESEVEQMKAAFGMSDEEKSRIRTLGGIDS